MSYYVLGQLRRLDRDQYDAITGGTNDGFLTFMGEEEAAIYYDAESLEYLSIDPDIHSELIEYFGSEEVADTDAVSWASAVKQSAIEKMDYYKRSSIDVDGTNSYEEYVEKCDLLSAVFLEQQRKSDYYNKKAKLLDYMIHSYNLKPTGSNSFWGSDDEQFALNLYQIGTFSFHYGESSEESLGHIDSAVSSEIKVNSNSGNSEPIPTLEEAMQRAENPRGYSLEQLASATYVINKTAKVHRDNQEKLINELKEKRYVYDFPTYLADIKINYLISKGIDPYDDEDDDEYDY